MRSWSTGLTFSRGGFLYVPFHAIVVAAGPFLNPASDAIESYLVVGPDVKLGVRDRFASGVPTPRRNVFAAQVLGDSMIDLGIHDGDICLFESGEEVRTGQIMLVEKAGPEEGEGAWAIKKIIFERPRVFVRNESGEETDWNDPVVVLRSGNRSIQPWRLDPAGRYRALGKYLRVCNARRVDCDSVGD